MKLFLLVTLKTIIETYKTLFITFWPLCVVFIVVDIFFNVPTNNIDPLFSIIAYLTAMLRQICIYLMALATYAVVRPSVGQKNYDYLLSYRKHLLNYTLFVLMSFLILGLLALIILQLFQGHIAPTFLLDSFNNMLLGDFSVKSIVVGGVAMIFGGILAIIAPFHLFFFLNSDGTFLAVCKSFLRAIKMAVYTLPCIIIIGAIMSSIYLVVIHAESLVNTLDTITIVGSYRIMLKASLLNIIKTFVYTPIFLCFWNNFYIKNIHDNFHLYFEKKGE